MVIIYLTYLAMTGYAWGGVTGRGVDLIHPVSLFADGKRITASVGEAELSGVSFPREHIVVGELPEHIDFILLRWTPSFGQNFGCP